MILVLVKMFTEMLLEEFIAQHSIMDLMAGIFCVRGQPLTF